MCILFKEVQVSLCSLPVAPNLGVPRSTIIALNPTLALASITYRRRCRRRSSASLRCRSPDALSLSSRGRTRASSRLYTRPLAPLSPDRGGRPLPGSARRKLARPRRHVFTLLAGTLRRKITFFTTATCVSRRRVRAATAGGAHLSTGVKRVTCDVT